MENFDLLKQYVNTELKNRIEPSVSEDIDPIIGEKTAEAPKVAVQAEAVAAPVIESAPTLASSEPTVSVDDIDVAHPTE